MSYSLIYSTFSNQKSAKDIAVKLVSERLVACANIIDNMSSVYMWEDKLCEESEVIMFLKTVSSNVERVTMRINELHEHEVPCVIAIKFDQGNKKFIKWIENSVKLDIK